jgi:hypothetical protein
VSADGAVPANRDVRSDESRAPNSTNTGARPERFTPEAAKEYADRIGSYVANLERISRIVANQKNTDDVSAHHVRLAAEALGAGAEESKKNRRMAELGVLLVGAASGYAGNVIIAEAYTFRNAIVFVIPFALGLFLYGITIGQD